MLTATFFGTSTVLVRDDRSAVLVDGFFSRPSLLAIATRVRPRPGVIAEVLERAGINRLNLVAVSHSHFDHALDAPHVASSTGARLLGSESTRMIAEGAGFQAGSWVTAEDRVAVTAGGMQVTPIHGVHSGGDLAPGFITDPLVPPASVRAYKTGECFGFLIEHGDGSVLVHGSANFLPGAYDGLHSDVVYLGAGAAGRQSEEWRESYWDAVVSATGARRVRPVHWDRFWRPLSKSLRPLPRRMDDLDKTMRTWRRKAERDSVELAIPRSFHPEPVQR